MSERRDLERGPTGDHGQTGDPGAAGAAGATGAQGIQGERGRDAKSWRLWPTLRLLAFILVAVAAIYSTARTYEIADDNRQTIQRVEANQKSIEAEGIERRDQICLSAEREHLRQVEQLHNTYLYLVNLPESELSNTFNRFIIAQVPQTEEQAKTDVAPAFCDEPGAAAEARYEKTNGKKGSPPVGLPEPDPVIKDRPQKVDDLLKQLAEQRPQLERN